MDHVARLPLVRHGVNRDTHFRDNIQNNNVDGHAGEYLTEAWGILRGLMVRTLLGYTHTSGPGGNALVPDLAADFPTVSDDGLTWTFTLRPGVRFGPPLNRDVTSKDVAYAFQRIATKSVAAQYAGYYLGTIAGMQDVYDGKADTISGIQTPDDSTIVFTLTEPTGDFAYRVSLPATAPIPAEVASCFPKAGQYGRYVISSGPYMIEGSDRLDATSCETMEPISGFKPDRSLSLVRNPAYDPATDSPAKREALPDGFQWTIDSNAQSVFDKLERGELDGEWASTPNKLIRSLLADGRLKLTPTDNTWYISMNLTQPPFDDIHVRKAMNLAVDKVSMRKVWGGEAGGQIATHIAPNGLTGGLLADYDPYATPDDAGDEAAAREEMKQSRYDTDGDGLCDTAECKDVVLVSTDIDRFRNLEPLLEQAGERIGISFKVRTLPDPFPAILTPKNGIPITNRLGWEKDYPDASTFLKILVGRDITPEGNVNTPLVGITPDQAAELGVTGTVDGIPSIDADFDACAALLVGDERTQCWADLDRKLMEDVVPWVPYLTSVNQDTIGPAVTYYDLDQSSGGMAYAHLAVDASKQ